MTNIIHEFESEVSQAVTMILNASRKVAVAKLEEAFAIDAGLPGSRRQSGKRALSGSCGPSRRRQPRDLDALADRFMKEIWANPGETVTVLASRLGVDPVELKVPVRRLRALGKFRTAGSRQFTKYFPVATPTDSQG